MYEKMKGLLSVFIGIPILLCIVSPMMSYDGQSKVSNTAGFAVKNAAVYKEYSANSVKNQPTAPESEASGFSFAKIRTLHARNIVVNHKEKTITMTANGSVRNVAVYHDQMSEIPGGTIKLADPKSASVKQEPGKFYIISNAGIAAVTVDITIGGVTKQYTLSVNFNEFVAENLRMYKRKIGSAKKDIVYGIDAGRVEGNEIHITPDAEIEYIGLTKYQAAPGNHNGIITPVEKYPVYATFEEEVLSDEPIFLDRQGCIFIKRPTVGNRVEFYVNYRLETEMSIYKVIVDFTEEPELNFSSVCSEHVKNVKIDHKAKTITMDSDGIALNIVIYKYRHGEKSNMQITLADKMGADVIQDNERICIRNDGTDSAAVLVDIKAGQITVQYKLNVNFSDVFSFCNIYEEKQSVK